MNEKGQVGLGTIIILFVAVVVGVILFTTIAQQVGTTTNTVTLANSSFTSASEGSSAYLTNYRSISGAVIYNATGTLVPAANYTITNNVVHNGGLAIEITTGAVNAYANDTWNISGTAQPLTYIPNSGGRTMATLIVLFFAFAVAATALYPVYGDKLLQMVGR